MNSPVDVDVLVKFALRIGIIFALIFVFALLTPSMAKLVEGWIERYRKKHDPDEDETYGVRSIYELPRKRRTVRTEEDYDLDTEEEEPDEEDYSLEYELEEPAPEEEAYDEPEPEEPEEFAEEPEEDVPQETEEPIYLFSFFRLEEKPYDLTLWKVKYRKAVPIDVGEQDFGRIVFGQPRKPMQAAKPVEPILFDEDEDAEIFIGESLIPCDADDDDGFFDDAEGTEDAFDAFGAIPAADGDDDDGDAPWFMR